MNFAISGISGRMGTTIYRIIHQRGHSLHAGFESPASPFIGNDAGLLIGLNGVNNHVSEINTDKLKGADAVIDFTSPSATMILLEAAVSTLTPGCAMAGPKPLTCSDAYLNMRRLFRSHQRNGPPRLSRNSLRARPSPKGRSFRDTNA